MANKTLVEKAAEKVGYGLAMAEDLAGTVRTAIGSVTEALKISPARKETKEPTAEVVRTPPTKKAPKKSPVKESPAGKSHAKKSPKSPAKESPAKRAVQKAGKKQTQKPATKSTRPRRSATAVHR
jgi:outer membrane biosynthesis protein TonB